ncbi:DUF349 domain-containing protein, partial [Xanthovirga aplysinae]|uniref:DUF349 domain-containing protein n=1 Tax=Xanthovirga aplysinae TaxID=2529853 RepID=UPI0012BD0470
LNAFLSYRERVIGEVRDDEASTFKYFEDRFQLAQKKVDDLEAIIKESENKGSYLMKMVHLKEQLAKFDALGDFPSLFERLDRMEKELRDLIAINRAKNLEIKRALLIEAEALKESTNWQETTEKFRELKMKWIKTGSVSEEYKEEIEQQFKDILDTFFARKQSFYEDRNKMVDSRVEAYKTIVEEVKKLNSTENVQKAAERVKELQKQWKTLGKIPRKRRDELWKELKSYTDNIFNNLKAFKKQKDSLSAEENLKRKEELLFAAEDLKERYNEEGILDTAKKLQAEWKVVGKVPWEKVKSLNERFHIACDLVFEQHFLEKVARSKFRSYKDKEEKEQIKLKITLLRDLLARDQKDLQTFEDNLAKLNSGANAFSKMLENKLSIQSRKVKVKELILSELKEKLKTNQS